MKTGNSRNSMICVKVHFITLKFTLPDIQMRPTIKFKEQKPINASWQKKFTFIGINLANLWNL